MYSGVMAAGAITGRDLLGEIRSGAVIADAGSLAQWPADFDALTATRSLKDTSGDR
ncbi:hypothetical protein [Williamsia sp. M5A3_1d]